MNDTRMIETLQMMLGKACKERDKLKRRLIEAKKLNGHLWDALDYFRAQAVSLAEYGFEEVGVIFEDLASTMSWINDHVIDDITWDELRREARERIEIYRTPDHRQGGE